MASEASGKSRRRLWPWVLVAAAAGGLPVLWAVNRLVAPPPNLGADGGQLGPCPDSPNCVSSQAADPGHAIRPLPCPGEIEPTLARLEQLVSSLPGTRLAERQPGYLRFEFRTTVCRFVDDVEFLADPVARVIHVRSASRLGYSDLGTNRRRIEEIRRRWATVNGSATNP